MLDIEKITEDFKKQLKDGFIGHKFEAYATTYLKALEETDDDVSKTIYYFDETNRIVRMYIRTKTETWNFSFPEKSPEKLEIVEFNRGN